MNDNEIRELFSRLLGAAPNASAHELHRCYADQVKKWHPDRLQHNPELATLAEQKIKEINQAYECLTDQDQFAKHGVRLANQLQKNQNHTENNHKSSSASTSPDFKHDRASDQSTSDFGTRTNAGDQSQTWHENYASAQRTRSSSTKESESEELVKFGGKICLWLALIFCLLSAVDSHMHPHPDTFSGSTDQRYVRAPSHSFFANSQPKPANRLLAPSNDSVAPPPGETRPQLNPIFRP